MTSQTDRKNGITGNLGIKAPVRCATTTNITLSGLQTIDGITVVADDRVLVKDQTTASENGIYNASTSTWQRALDFDGINDITQGTLVVCSNGTTNSNSVWRLSSANPITLDTSNITFVVSSSGSSSGSNTGDQTITLTGDVTGTGTGSFAATIADNAVSNAKIADNAVSNAKIAQVATATFKGRTTSGTGNVEDLTATQATALLNEVVGDSGSGGTKGLVPAPASGDAAALKFLKADGTWSATPGGNANATESVAGIAEIATQAETIAGTASKIVDPAKLLALFGTSYRSTNGYARLPVKVSGSFVEMIIQWGAYTDSSWAHAAQKTITLPITCPNSILWVGHSTNSSSVSVSSSSYPYTSRILNKTTYSFTCDIGNYAGSTINATLDWIVIGY